MCARSQALTRPTAVLAEAETYVPGVTPQLSDTPGGIYAPAPEVGEHNDEIYRGLLGLDDAELEPLRDAGAI